MHAPNAGHPTDRQANRAGFRTHAARVTRVSGVLLVVAASFCACTGHPVIDAAIGVGRSLLKAAATNYAPDYSEDLSRLVEALVRTPDSPVSSGAKSSLDAMEAEIGGSPTIASSMADGSTAGSGKAATKPGTDGSSGDEEPISLEVNLLKEVQLASGNWQPVPLENGGRATSENLIKMSFRANVECFVYVISIDSTGWAQTIFPNESERFGVSYTNPVRADREYWLPEGEEWYELDTSTGVENLYFVASRERRADLEEVLADLADRVRPELVAAETVAVEEPAVVERGFKRKRQGRSTTVKTSDSVEHEVVPAQFLGELTSGSLVVTRWFFHD